eukprot:832318-Ditylum_brightwellii.AAC.1
MTNNNLVFPLPICQCKNTDLGAFNMLAKTKISINDAHHLCMQLLGKRKKETKAIIKNFLNGKEGGVNTISTLSHDNPKSGNGKKSTEVLWKGNKNIRTNDNNSKEDDIISNNKKGNNKEQPMDLDQNNNDIR